MGKRERSIETSKTKEGTRYQRNVRREKASGRGAPVFVFHNICFGGYHDNAFKIELLETTLLQGAEPIVTEDDVFNAA
jgi:hypothetical protein